jgi:hypothetical protein
MGTETSMEQFEAVRRKATRPWDEFPFPLTQARDCFLDLCAALLAVEQRRERECEALEEFVEAVRSHDHNNASGRADDVLMDQANRLLDVIADSLPPNGLEECEEGSPNRAHVGADLAARNFERINDPRQADSAIQAPRGRGAETATAETAARVERFAVRKRSTGAVGDTFWRREDAMFMCERLGAADPIRLVELRAGEGIWSRKAVARDAATIAPLRAELAALRAELKSARDDAAEWELEAVEHQANTERLAALSATEGWVAGVVAAGTVHYNGSAEGWSVTENVVAVSHLSRGTRVLVRKAAELQSPAAELQSATAADRPSAESG